MKPLSEDMRDNIDGDLPWFDTLLSGWIVQAESLELEVRKLRDQLELAEFAARMSQAIIRDRNG